MAKGPEGRWTVGLEVVVHSQHFVTILGPGQTKAEDVEEVLHLAPVLVAADGGANRALALGHTPDAVIGDFDSVSESALRSIPSQNHHRIREQTSTDFEKCVSRIDAPLAIALGFSGDRVDHSLAVLSVLARYVGPPCIVISGTDVVFAAPERLRLELEINTRLSLFPMASIRGRSIGLEWPIDDLTFSPIGRIGTSNRVTGPVDLEFDEPGMLVILPRCCLAQAIAALSG